MSSRLIMKFGGALVQDPLSFEKLANLVLERQQEFPQIVVVTSAMGAMTDELFSLAHQVHPSPSARELDMLVSAGERISMALLAMAIQKQGGEAVSLTGSQSGIITCTEHSDARIVDVRPTRLLEHLNRGQIVIVAGYQGVSQAKEITTLGRGGSDTTAVALGVALEAERVEFYKDVGAIYTADPKADNTARPLSSLNFDEALQVVGERTSPIHPRAIRLAKQNSLPMRILGASATAEEGTWVGRDAEPAEARSRVFEEGVKSVRTGPR